jgi:ABC-2 type transport system ATP-binding protein
VTHPAERRQIRGRTGFLPQHFGYFASFTALDFVEYATWLKGVPSRRVKALALESLARVDMASRASQAMRTLSGGMLRRVGIAQAIAHKPDFVVLDEPTVGLDPQQRIEFRTIIRDLSADTNFLISTHLVDEVAHLGDIVTVLSDGRVVFQGAPHELARQATGQAVGDTNMERGYTAVLTMPASEGAR